MVRSNRCPTGSCFSSFTLLQSTWLIFSASCSTVGANTALLSRGSGEYSALLSTDELEKMAADEDVKKKNMGILDNAVAKLDDMKAKLGDKADDVTRIGAVLSYRPLCCT